MELNEMRALEMTPMMNSAISEKEAQVCSGFVAQEVEAAAMALGYGEERLEFSGPLFQKAILEGTRIRVVFDHARGLTLRSPEGFEVAAEDGKFLPATAQVNGETVIVSSAEVASPRYVRYAWADNPKATLFNGAGLPAAPFRTKR